jgi:hypothetical protein
MSALSAITELTGMAAVPGRATVLASQIRDALQDSATDEHRELFLAVYQVLSQRQRGAIKPEAWRRAWDALGALLPHYDIDGPEDVQALERAARNEQLEAA